MTREEILNHIKTLAMSQGFYGRLLRQIDESPQILDQLEQTAKEEGWKDVLDLVLYLES